MKICYTGGGTGGHIFPLFSIDRHMKTLPVPTENSFYITSEKDQDRRWLESEGVRFYRIRGGKLRRYFSFQNAADIFNIIAAFFQSVKILKIEKPVLLFSKGGYVSLPPVAAAYLLRIPIVAHESDSTASLTSKIAVRMCARMCIAREEVSLTFPDRHRHKCVVTGVPTTVHFDLEHAMRIRKERKRPLILILGGSQGAVQINELIFPVIDRLLAFADIVHQTGEGKENGIRKMGYTQIPFLHDSYEQTLYESTVVLSRSGATVIADLIEMEVPPILIPIPLKASRGDQQDNARYLQRMKAAVVLDSDTVDSSQVLQSLEGLLQDPQRLEIMRENLRKLKGKRSEELIARVIIDTLDEKNGTM
ncbi:MAG: UDP-N-acetylglucosamine--N-acetylmuramyl-(pentapeptide) pyrophosphoryl-undecaprenol N-acetylglucosamine transferase [Sphaerochaetaceae bacterium]|nr:UDP-N-acetylglucosamine--N-acetylmuramyl-(pentapeptide) pyrophosphoryl-undecaprenol N-acetylglucosamine transferase [Sphaerochaetaceae bacterium]